MVPYVLFVYKEVPQESTGFLPFELIYYKDVRGPLDVLKKRWNSGQKEMDDILIYVMKTQERMELVSQLAHKNLRTTKQKHKEWYDRKARMEMREGHQVLLLLPDCTKKFQLKWQGPFKVNKKLGKVNYKIIMPKQGNSKVAHIKEVASEGDGVCSCYLGRPWYRRLLLEGRKETLWVGEELGTEQWNVTKDQLRQTHLLTHSIPMRTAWLIQLKFYCIPIAYWDEVEQELQEMELDGIIKKPSSELASPIVIATKKNGGLQICVDYRRLNQVMTFMPTQCKSTQAVRRNLRSSVYNHPWSSKRLQAGAHNKWGQSKTAYGLYQFTVMPFGLSGVPAMFQRLMDTELWGMTKFTGVYLDDIMICAALDETPISHNRSVPTSTRTKADSQTQEVHFSSKEVHLPVP